VGADPRATEVEGKTALGGETGGPSTRENRSPDFDGDSPPVIRFRVVREVAKHG
jgi:hypothetical protein